jgi:hypothetical protein
MVKKEKRELTTQDVEDVKQMIRQTEAELSEFISDEQLTDIRNYAFDYAHREAGVYGINPGDSKYDYLCLARRLEIVEVVSRRVKKLVSKVDGEIVITLPKIKSMKRHLAEGGNCVK